jgi:hypothetical protein
VRLNLIGVAAQGNGNRDVGEALRGIMEGELAKHRAEIKKGTTELREGKKPLSVDAEIRDMTALMYAAMGRLQVIRRTFASSLGLNSAEFAVLISLHRAQAGARIKELAESIHIAAANVTATVKSLERRGLGR